MSRVAAGLNAPALPQVNLLPEEIRDARTLGVVKRWVAVSVAATAFVVGAGTVAAHLQRDIAQSELAQAEAGTAQLVLEQQPFADVTSLRTELGTVAAARASALGREVLWSTYLDAFAAATPDGVRIAKLDFLSAGPASAAESDDPLIATGLGTISFVGAAGEVPDAAAWADALDAVPGLDDARIDTVRLADDVGHGRYQISGTVQVDAAALSHRFDTQTGSTS